MSQHTLNKPYTAMPFWVSGRNSKYFSNDWTSSRRSITPTTTMTSNHVALTWELVATTLMVRCHRDLSLQVERNLVVIRECLK